jgi:hypothetical protein
MVWDEFTLKQFGLINPLTTDENDFLGPYNSLLLDLFPSAEHYQVAPQFRRIANSSGLAMLFIVMKRRVPVLFIEIKTFMGSRASADQEMRERICEFASGILPSKLIGISAMGTRFAVYEYTPEDREIIPLRIAPHPDIMNNTAPKERWKYELLEADGEAKFKAIVAEIKTMSLAISGDCEYYSFSFSSFLLINVL